MTIWIICDAIARPSLRDSMLSFMLGLMPWIFLYIYYTATIWWTNHACKTIQLLPPLQFSPLTVRKFQVTFQATFRIIQQEGRGEGTHHFASRDLKVG